MNSVKWTWTVCGVIYAAFFYWYTSFGGPLSDEEIQQYMAYFERQADRLDRKGLERMRYFMETDTGDDFVMINVIDIYDVPLQVEGVIPGETSDEVMGKYTAYMYPAMFSRASHPVIAGAAANVAMDLMNAPGMERWDQGAGIRYRSRRDLLEIATNPAFSGSHTFKVAAMEKTIAFPIDPWFHFGDPRLLFALILGCIALSLSWRAALKR